MLRSLSLLLALLVLAPGAAPAQDISEALAKASRQVAAFLDQVSDVKCTEQVTQLKLGPKDRIEYSAHSTFDYFVLLQAGEDDLLLNESRLAVGKATRPATHFPLLTTNGFSTLFLIFHPYYRPSFEFSYDGEEGAGGERVVRVRFTHRPGMRTPAALAVRGREYPLDLAGTAWIDPASGMIVRIDATVADMRDVGLRALHSQIEYGPIRLPGWTQEYRFPTIATIDVETLRQHWRNIHRFSNYSRFVVDTQVTVSTDKIEKK